MDDERVVGGSLFGFVDSFRCSTSRRICTEPVHGFCGKGDGDVGCL